MFAAPYNQVPSVCKVSYILDQRLLHLVLQVVNIKYKPQYRLYFNTKLHNI